MGIEPGNTGEGRSVPPESSGEATGALPANPEAVLPNRPNLRFPIFAGKKGGFRPAPPIAAPAPIESGPAAEVQAQGQPLPETLPVTPGTSEQQDRANRLRVMGIMVRAGIDPAVISKATNLPDEVVTAHAQLEQRRKARAAAATPPPDANPTSTTTSRDEKDPGLAELNRLQRKSIREQEEAAGNTAEPPTQATPPIGPMPVSPFPGAGPSSRPLPLPTSPRISLHRVEEPADSYDEVFRLAAQGIPLKEIAQRTLRGTEEVRLLLKFREMRERQRAANPPATSAAEPAPIQSGPVAAWLDIPPFLQPKESRTARFIPELHPIPMPPHLRSAWERAETRKQLQPELQVQTNAALTKLMDILPNDPVLGSVLTPAQFYSLAEGNPHGLTVLQELRKKGVVAPYRYKGHTYFTVNTDRVRKILNPQEGQPQPGGVAAARAILEVVPPPAQPAERDRLFAFLRDTAVQYLQTIGERGGKVDTGRIFKSRVARFAAAVATMTIVATSTGIAIYQYGEKEGLGEKTLQAITYAPEAVRGWFEKQLAPTEPEISSVPTVASTVRPAVPTTEPTPEATQPPAATATPPSTPTIAPTATEQPTPTAVPAEQPAEAAIPTATIVRRVGV